MNPLPRRALAWSVLVALAVVTLGPLRFRPHLSFDPSTDRILGYGALGYALTLAYPRRPVTIALLVVLCAAGLEAAQAFIPGRHARLQDAQAKAFGGVAGVGLAALPAWLATRALGARARSSARDKTT